MDSTKLIYGQCPEHNTTNDLGRAVSIGGDLAAKVNELINRVDCVDSDRKSWTCTTMAHILDLHLGP